MKKLLALAGTALLLVACNTTGDTDVQDVTVSKAPIPGSAGDFKTNVKDRVFFALNKSHPTAADAAVLKDQASWFKMYPQTSADIEGHCDERGSREYNLALGNRRAQAVKNELTKMGVTSDRLKTISFGKDKPPVMGSGEASWAQQRTAVTVVR